MIDHDRLVYLRGESDAERLSYGELAEIHDALYKAVRPDGTDFFTGTVRWAPKAGPARRARVVRHPRSAEAVPGDFATFLSVSTDPTYLPGSSWPLRLLEVEPVDGAPVLTVDQSKRGAVAWRVVREVDSRIRFGPMGEHVAALVDRAGRLTIDEARRLAAAGAAAWAAAGAAAWAAAVAAARADAWDAAGAAAWDAAWDATGAAAGAAAWAAAGAAARAAAWDAAVRDLIGSHGFTQGHYDALARPWRTVVGPIHPDDEEMS